MMHASIEAGKSAISNLRHTKAEPRGLPSRGAIFHVMAAAQMAMLAKTPYPIVRDAVIAHLTFAEGLGPLLSNVVLRPVMSPA
jgi:hypothetical protein